MPFIIPPSLVIDSIVFANIVTLLSLGLTITYMTTRVPNFAHGSLAMVGFYIAHTVYYLTGVEPCLLIPVAGLAGGVAALLMYILVLRPLIRRGASLLMLMIATFAVDIILYGMLSMYAETLVSMGIPGYKIVYRDWAVIDHITVSLIASTAVLMLFMLTMTYFLYRTKLGIGMSAVVENPSLSGFFGIDVDKIRMLSWFIAGFLAGAAGILIPYRIGINSPIDGSMMLPEIFAASIVGGLESLYGTLIGGYLVGLSESIIPYILSLYYGPAVLGYEKMIPLVLVAAALLLFPRGIAEVIEERLARRRVRA